MGEVRKTSKYLDAVRSAINTFWKVNHYPPTTRDIVNLSGIKSTSDIKSIVRGMNDMRINRGRIIPIWVDRLFADE